jgi:TolB protein
VNVDGSGLSYLTLNPLGVDFSDYGPVWSPDGTRIAFECDTEGGGPICVVNADGSDRRQLTNGQYFDSNPAWSPDSQWIAFESDRDEAEDTLFAKDIYVVRADGADLTRRTTHPADDHSPAWAPAPDGRDGG